MARTKHFATRTRNRTGANATPSSPAAPSTNETSGEATPATSPTTGRKKNKGRPAMRAKPPGSFKKPHRFRPGTVALREIRKFQKSTKPLIPAASFIREVRSITHNVAHESVNRWTAEALVALQEAAEEYLVALFSNAMLCAIHARRVTLMRRDFELARRLGGIGRPW